MGGLSSSSPPVVRLAVIEGDVYVERVPGYWVKVAAYKDYSECNLDVKVYLIQNALVHGDDFEYTPTSDQILA
jgi:hypothetical protein